MYCLLSYIMSYDIKQTDIHYIDCDDTRCVFSKNGLRTLTIYKHGNEDVYLEAKRHHTLLIREQTRELITKTHTTNKIL